MKFIRKTKFGIPSALIVLSLLGVYFFFPPAIKTEAGCNTADAEEHTITVTAGSASNLPSGNDNCPAEVEPPAETTQKATFTEGSWECTCGANGTIDPPDDFDWDSAGHYTSTVVNEDGEEEEGFVWSASCGGCEAEVSGPSYDGLFFFRFNYGLIFIFGNGDFG